ncbi:MAG: DUF86 domain-containing protein [Candidatus Woesearchaeota archaeon]
MRIKDKAEEIERYLDELSGIIPETFEQYETSNLDKAACERYFERIIEAVVDLAFLLIKEKRCKTPEEDKQAFDILSDENIITKELSEKLKDAKGMRNIIAHEYGKIDDDLVFRAIKEKLGDDVDEFIRAVRKAVG